MSARAILSDSCPVDADFVRTQAFLDDDCPGPLTPTDADPQMPVVVVQVRVSTGFSVEGNPTFEWTEIVNERAYFWQENTDRLERDDIAGMTDVRARLSVLYEGDERVTESALVTIDGDVWDVIRCAQLSDRLQFELRRIDDEEQIGD